jgi:hypothetical protein
MSRLLCVALLVGGLLAGCGGASGSSGASSGGASTTTGVAGPTTTSTTIPPATLPPLHLTSALASATHLIDAWKASDRMSAAQAATPAAVSSLFTQGYQPTQSRGCDGGSPESDCFYRLGSTGGLRFHVTRQADGSWVVTEASLAG